MKFVSPWTLVLKNRFAHTSIHKWVLISDQFPYIHTESASHKRVYTVLGMRRCGCGCGGGSASCSPSQFAHIPTPFGRAPRSHVYVHICLWPHQILLRPMHRIFSPPSSKSTGRSAVGQCLRSKLVPATLFDIYAENGHVLLMRARRKNFIFLIISVRKRPNRSETAVFAQHSKYTYRTVCVRTRVIEINTLVDSCVESHVWKF